MAGVSDKARFYLEQSVPELVELERKNLFSKPELTSITARRSTHEHTLHSRAVRPLNYAHAVEYESNLHTLLRKRANRLGLKRDARHHHAQQHRRIRSLLDRGTRRFPGDLGLWMQYLQFTRRQMQSERLFGEILTRCLRLHPTKAELWIFAATDAVRERGDVEAARGYLLRGLRFCKGERRLWEEFARLEWGYVAKLWGRRRVLGIPDGDDGDDVKGGTRTESRGDADGGDQEVEAAVAGFTVKGDFANGDERQKQLIEKKLDGAPDFQKVLSGAIAKAVFDAAMAQFEGDVNFAARFFDTVAETDIPPRSNLLDHVLQTLQSSDPDHLETHIRLVERPTLGIEATSADFPLALDTALDRLSIALNKLEEAPKANFISRISDWLENFIEAGNADEDVQIALRATMKALK